MQWYGLFVLPIPLFHPQIVRPHWSQTIQSIFRSGQEKLEAVCVSEMADLGNFPLRKVWTPKIGTFWVDDSLNQPWRSR